MADRIFQIKAKIANNLEVAKNYYKIILPIPQIAKSAKPGQFVEIKISDDPAPLLRRPLGVHRVYGLNIEILYEKLGRGTEILSQKRAGEYLDIIGPLGNGFEYGAQEHPALPAGRKSARAQILVAGGMGVAPLAFLAERLVHSSCLAGRQEQFTVYGESLVLIGAKTKDSVLCEKEFKALGCEAKIATDDGSKGFKGKVTELLKAVLMKNSINPSNPMNSIYACGPKSMLKEIASISKQYNIPAQVSLEAHMACGIGACLGCAVNTKEGYKRVCKEGPVFGSQEIIW